ncbi:MAG TPA: hypothetical protein VG148_06275 [Pyrinomonadaceae bacterium]|nr:hypothetical protein [Pyrinomonadaceae bacterium]
MKNARARLVTAILILAASVGAAAQTRPPADAQSAGPPAQSADEDFVLDIVERRIVEQDFLASTEVATDGEDPRGLDLRVGAVVRASEIDVQLRNVRARVRFRASLGPLLRLLDVRRGKHPPAP